MSTPKIFISHSRNDSDWVRRFAQALRKQNIDVWDDQEIQPGERWKELIEKRLRESDAIVVLLSHSNVQSPNLFFDLGVALGTGKKLIAVIAEDLDPSSIPREVRLRRYLLKREPDETAQEVASAVKAA